MINPNDGWNSQYFLCCSLYYGSKHKGGSHKTSAKIKFSSKLQKNNRQSKENRTRYFPTAFIYQLSWAPTDSLTLSLCLCWSHWTPDYNTGTNNTASFTLCFFFFSLKSWEEKDFQVPSGNHRRQKKEKKKKKKERRNGVWLPEKVFDLWITETHCQDRQWKYVRSVKSLYCLLYLF